ncbi:MAG: DUF1801 domain-containing protein [Sphingomicrobium sp.]
MVSSKALTPDDYLAELEPQRAAELKQVRDCVNSAMPDGYCERMAWGMISWEAPIERSGPTYNQQPLVYAALAAQKNYNSLYLNCAYASADRIEQLARAFAASGHKLNMGKSCIRFRRAADLNLDAVRDEIASASPDEFIALTAASRAR